MDDYEDLCDLLHDIETVARVAVGVAAACIPAAIALGGAVAILTRRRPRTHPLDQPW